jgi:hypothetical protein
MAADNHTTIVGNLVENPEFRFTNNGIAATNCPALSPATPSCWPSWGSIWTRSWPA